MNFLDAAVALIKPAAGLCCPGGDGCGSFCCQALASAGGRIVSVTLADVVAIVSLLERSRNEAVMRTRVECFLQKHCAVSPVTGACMLTGQPGKACPFLEAGVCTIYSARPMACRLFVHCEWAGESYQRDLALERVVARTLLSLSKNLGSTINKHDNLFWQQPWRYDEVEV